MINYIFFIILFCLFFTRPCPAAPETDTLHVLAMGDSRIYTDILAARSAAVTECLQTAVEEMAITMVPADILTQKFELISNLISARRNEYITTYKVLKEISTEKNYQVLVQVTVSGAKLTADLAEAGVIVSTQELPVLLFLISEQQADDIAPQYWWRKEKSLFQANAAGAALTAPFKAKAFPVIDTETVPMGFFDDLALSARLTDDEAVEIGRRLNADIVVTGSAVVREMANRMGASVLTFQGTVSARALITETGEQIAETTAAKTRGSRDIAAGSNDVLSAAGAEAGESLSAQITAAWYKHILPPGEITLRIAGNDILPHLVLFRNELEKIEGVTGQQTREMTPDEAVLAVQYNSTAQALADALLLKTFDAFGISIHEITHNAIVIELAVE